MQNGAFIEIRIGRGAIVMMLVALVLLFVFLILPGQVQAQKTQEKFGDKFNIAEATGGVGVAASSDGKYVYVVGPAGILVSDDFGKTGTWSQTVRLK